MIAYFNGKFQDHDQIKISPYDRGFQFADGVYEVIRFYYDHFFQTEAHLQRMAIGLAELKIDNVELSNFKGIINELIKKNDLTGKQAIAYLQVTRGAYFPRRHIYPSTNIRPTIFIDVSLFDPHPHEIIAGAKIYLTEDIRWSRCDIKSIALLPNILARQEGLKNGAAETVFVRDGKITEGTHTNFCAIKNGQLFTHPLNNFILSGITRKIVLKICENLNIPVIETPVLESEIRRFDELLIIGTTAEITPVVQVNDQLIGARQPGPLTRQMQQEFFKLVCPKQSTILVNQNEKQLFDFFR